MQIMTTKQKPAAKTGKGKGKTPKDIVEMALEATGKPYIVIRLATSSILKKDHKPGSVSIKTNMMGESVIVTLSQILSEIQMQHQGVKVSPGDQGK